MESIWKKYLKPIDNVKKTDAKVTKLDCIVVGGGIAGIMCAYMLAKEGQKVTIIEAAQVLGGVTSNTTAHVTSLQGRYRDIPGAKRRKLFFQSQQQGIDGIEELVNKHKIDCDFQRTDGIVFGNGKPLKKEFKVMKKISSDIRLEKNKKLPFGDFDCITLNMQARFNPINFCYGIIKAGNFDIIENCRIKKVCLMKKRLETENMIFKYNKVVFATGFPIINIRGIYAFKMYKSSSYAICKNNSQQLGAIYNSVESDGMTYRDSEDGVIIGGFDHRTGRHKCSKYFSKLGDGKFKWAANDCMTFDGIPYAGRLLRVFARDTYVISGFSKYGMVNSFISAKIIADTVSRKKNLYKRLFKPTRVLNVKVWPLFFLNFLLDAKNLTAGLFSSGKRRCPHMGCRLKFNPNTKTFDCPCHGSRLTKKGDIIISPTVDANEKLL